MPFTYKEAAIPGLIIIEPRIFDDPRGFFLESYKKSDFIKMGISEEFQQDNHSFSSRGVLRGLHFQRAPKAQGKLVRVLQGAVWDVAVDLRKKSPFYGKWFGLEISAENKRMFYIPPGFAHGFLTLKDNTHFLYKCTEEYDPATDGGIHWDDPDIAVAWPIEKLNVELSDKDKILPFLKEIQ